MTLLNSTSPLITKITAVVLAGGQASRMNYQDKGLIDYHGCPMVSYALKALEPLADEVIINANRNIDRYQQFGCPVIADQTNSFDGPLAGVLSAMLYAQTGVLLVMPCDSPLFTAKHLQKILLHQLEHDADVAVACDGAKMHPVFLAVKATLYPNLQAYLSSGERKLAKWIMQQNAVLVDFGDEPEIFANINTTDELSTLESSVFQ